MAVNVIKFSQFVSATLTNTTNMLVGVSSSSGGHNFQQPATISWTTANRPGTPYNGLEGYNTDLSQWEYWNGSSWVQFAAGGSGTVNTGAINQLAYYAANGTALSGLTSANNSILATNGVGVPAWATTFPSGLTLPIPLIVGITNASDAAAGDVGEIVSSVVSAGSSVSISNNIPANITSLSLTAGDYDIEGNVYFIGSSNNLKTLWAWSSPVSATLPDASLVNRIDEGLYRQIGFSIPFSRSNSSSAVTIYLSCEASFATGSAVVCGGIYARRRR